MPIHQVLMCGNINASPRSSGLSSDWPLDGAHADYPMNYGHSIYPAIYYFIVALFTVTCQENNRSEMVKNQFKTLFLNLNCLIEQKITPKLE